MCCYLLNSKITRPGLAATQFDWKIKLLKNKLIPFCIARVVIVCDKCVSY